MKQTAVEWLYEKILLTPLDIREINKCLEKAKAMEKEQITDSYIMGSYDMAEKKFRPNQYYNETYKSE